MNMAYGCVTPRWDHFYYPPRPPYYPPPGLLPPLSIPHKCPVCGGRGRVDKGFYEEAQETIPGELNCRSCHGAGVLWND